MGGWECAGAAGGFCWEIDAAGDWFGGSERGGGGDATAGVEDDADGGDREGGGLIIGGGIVVGGVGPAMMD